MSRKKPNKLTLVQKQALPGKLAESWREYNEIFAIVKEAQRVLRWSTQTESWKLVEKPSKVGKDRLKAQQAQQVKDDAAYVAQFHEDMKHYDDS